MNEQNFSNHVRVHPLYHYFIVPVSLVLVVVAIVNLVLHFDLTNVLLVLTAILLHLVAFIARDYAKKNQDRIIRAEMHQRIAQFNNRSFSAVVSQLSFSQLAALRFAPDEELVLFLADPGIAKLSSSAIKQLIKNWKPDHMRV